MKKYFAVAMSVLMLSGCAGEAKNNDNISLETEATTAASSGGKDSYAGNPEDNYIDYNVVCANINIEGKKYSMPFTFNDMDGFTCKEAKVGKSEGYCMASLQNDEGKKLIIEIKDEEQNRENLSNKPVTSILVSSYVKDLEGNYFYDNLEEQSPKVDFNGVKLGMTLEEVQAAWGVADTFQPRDVEGTAYNYMTADQKISVQVTVDSENKVYSIALVNHRI